jgi:hypothetical protein
LRDPLLRSAAGLSGFTHAGGEDDDRIGGRRRRAAYQRRGGAPKDVGVEDQEVECGQTDDDLRDPVCVFGGRRDEVFRPTVAPSPRGRSVPSAISRFIAVIRLRQLLAWRPRSAS